MIRKIVNILRYVFVRHRKYQFARQGKKVIIGNGCIINSASMQYYMLYIRKLFLGIM